MRAETIERILESIGTLAIVAMTIAVVADFFGAPYCTAISLIGFLVYCAGGVIGIYTDPAGHRDIRKWEKKH